MPGYFALRANHAIERHRGNGFEVFHGRMLAERECPVNSRGEQARQEQRSVVAGELATTERTIKFHRAHIMQKMKAQSLANLVRMVEKLAVNGS